MFNKIFDALIQFGAYLNPFFIVCDYESGIVLRLGKFSHHVTGGLNIKIPVIDSIFLVKNVCETLRLETITITTADDKTITSSVIVEYRVIDAANYFLNNSDPKKNIHDVIMGLFSSQLRKIQWSQKDSLDCAKENIISHDLSHMGINIINIFFEDMCLSKVFIINR